MFMPYLTKKDYLKHQLAIAKAKAASVETLYSKAKTAIGTNVQLQAVDITSLSYSLAMINAEVEYLHEQINLLTESINT